MPPRTLSKWQSRMSNLGRGTVYGRSNPTWGTGPSHWFFNSTPKVWRRTRVYLQYLHGLQTLLSRSQEEPWATPELKKCWGSNWHCHPYPHQFPDYFPFLRLHAKHPLPSNVLRISLWLLGCLKSKLIKIFLYSTQRRNTSWFLLIIFTARGAKS